MVALTDELMVASTNHGDTNQVEPSGCRREDMAKSSIKSLHATLPQPRFSKGAKQRAIIVDAIIESLATTGLDGTTFESIAQRCGLKRPHIVYYFPNRDAMILGAMLHVAACAQQETISLLVQEVTPEGQMGAIVDGAFSWAQKFPRQVSVLLLFYHGTSYNQSFMKLNQEIRNLGRQRIGGVLLQRHPKLSQQVIDQVAFELQFRIIGSILWIRSEGLKRDLERQRTAVRGMCLAALAAPEAWLKALGVGR